MSDKDMIIELLGIAEVAIDSQEIISRYYTKIADYHHYIQRKKSR